MVERCKWLHDQLAQLHVHRFPFDLDELLPNGIYFFYEKGEMWGHGGDEPRVVRVGSHTGQGNLPSRIDETYLLDKRRLRFTRENAKPADRSIFRKNLGRAFLNRDGDDYLQTWEIDFTTKRNRDLFGLRRDMDAERRLEESISRLLRDHFSFRVIAVEAATERRELERHLIGTLARCEVCASSVDWFGRQSPKRKIREGRLWQVQNVVADPIGARDRDAILRAIGRTAAPARCLGE